MKLKKLLFILSFVLITSFSFSQEFLDPGDQGHPPEGGLCVDYVEGHYEFIGFYFFTPMFVYIPGYCAEWN